MSVVDYIESKPELLQADELVFFGGSFNPWHQGHEACVALLPADKALVVVPDHNPYKELTAKNPESLADIRAALSKLDRGGFVFEGFLKANKKNPTHDWIGQLRSAFPEKKLSLLMGFDSFIGIDKWIEAEKLLNDLSRLYVASRLDNSAAKQAQIKRLEQINPCLETLFLGGHPHESLSSSALRKKKA